MNINEITTQSSIARNDKSSSETNLTTYRLNDLTSFLDMVFLRFTSHFSRKRVAFTLAEVLITLGIIGVVAAFTLPSVIAKYQEKVWTTSYLRVYSLLENAYRSAIYENGTVDNWPGSVKGRIDSAGRLVDIAVDKNVVYEYMFKPRLKPNESILKLSSGSTGCMPKHYNLLTGRLMDNVYYHIDVPMISLQSGECIILNKDGAHFLVDLNGPKAPNTLGKDVHLFSFDSQNLERLKPGCMTIWWTDSPNYCDYRDDHGWDAGMSCGFWIVRNHNMDYLHLSFEDIVKNWHGGVW